MDDSGIDEGEEYGARVRQIQKQRGGLVARQKKERKLLTE